MTETTFPFGAVQGGAEDAEQEPDRRRLLLVLGGGLAAVALVGAAVFTFTGGSDELPLGPGALAPVSGAAGSDTVAPVEQPQTVPVANTEATARSPFEPKYVAPAPVVEAEAAPDPAGEPAAPVVRDADGTIVVVAPGTPGAPVAGVPGERAPAPVTPAPRDYRLVLIGVATEDGVHVAEFTIDGAVSKVKATEIFGPHSQLLLRSLQEGPKDGQWTATIQVGDARPIDVVTGNAVYVQ